MLPVGSEAKWRTPCNRDVPSGIKRWSNLRWSNLLLLLLLLSLLLLLLILLLLFLKYILFTIYYLLCSIVESLSKIISHSGSDNRCVESWFSVSTDADPDVCVRTMRQLYYFHPCQFWLRWEGEDKRPMPCNLLVRMNNFFMLAQFVHRWSRLLHGSHKRTMHFAHCLYMWLFFVTFSFTHLWSSIYITQKLQYCRMLEVNFIRGGGDMYGLQASTAIINSGIFFFFLSSSLSDPGRYWQPYTPLLHLPYTGHRRRPGTLRCPVNVPVEWWAGVSRCHIHLHIKKEALTQLRLRKTD